MKDMMDRHLPPADVAAKPKAPAKPVARKPATIHEAAIGKP